MSNSDISLCSICDWLILINDPFLCWGCYYDKLNFWNEGYLFIGAKDVIS